MAQTLALMKTEYAYPRLGDRLSIGDWRDAGEKTIWDRAVARVREIMAEPPSHLPPDREALIRERFDIELDPGTTS